MSSLQHEGAIIVLPANFLQFDSGGGAGSSSANFARLAAKGNDGGGRAVAMGLV